MIDFTIYPHVRKTRSLQGRDIRTYKLSLNILRYFKINGINTMKGTDFFPMSSP